MQEFGRTMARDASVMHVTPKGARLYPYGNRLDLRAIHFGKGKALFA